MVSYEMLNNLTEKEVGDIAKLRTFADKARIAEEQIKETWTFEAGEKEVVVWEDDEDGATALLSHDGKWRIEVAGKGSYTLSCDASTIFDHFYAEYVYKDERPRALLDEKIGTMAEVCEYLKKFLKHTEEKYDLMTR